ncbi:alpha/beta fold hydrolase [Lederbergia citri]|uniref:Alpha/beta hydrolase n=1 Tax=Lederbergia citri TaxID=2833580 RepID=A0A942TEB1_9BACI|nr:alpha/beta hydrolase [Lederbergia citri]MBS4196305.1 alpha/beta hydrolase [Lederbergia citri]
MFSRMTPKIEGTNAISEIRKVNIGGVDQWLLIRGENKNLPLLLMLHGGPGAAQIGFIREYQQELEKHFIVVNWDQRGAGLSYKNSIPIETMNINQFLHDAIEVVDYIKRDFHKEKVFLLGHSWGSLLGMLAISKFPEHFIHYFGVSQVVNMSKAEELSYELLLERARETNNQKAIKDLEKIGKPPWKHLKHDRVHQKYLELMGGGISHDGKLVNEIVKKLLKSKEYTIFDAMKYVNGQLFSMKAMLDELRQFDLTNEVKEVKVPISFIMGSHDLTVPSLPTKEFFNTIEAPFKEWFIFNKSAHSPNFEEREKFTRIVLEAKNRYLNIREQSMTGL